MRVPEKPEDPFADQLEWLEHRYDPGHFLGGTLRPELRLSLGKRAKRVAAILAFLSGGVLAVGALMTFQMGSAADPWAVMLAPLSLLVGIKMWMSARPEKPAIDVDPDPDTANEGRKIGQVMGMVALAALFAAALVVGLLVLVAGLVAVSRGAVDVVAGIFVLIAILAIRKRSR